MRKLCLILTVLYAFGANCSAQSSLNIAENLLTGDNSTFESSMGSWTCNDDKACSIANESGRTGKCLKLTNTGAGNDYDKQMEYSLSGHTPANGKKYVIKFWAKSNGASEKGNIKVLLQKNAPDEKYPQIAFGGKSISIAETWKQYEYDLITDRGDYEVIKINFGNCGEVWIDDIEYGEYSDKVAPVPATGVTLNRRSASVKQGRSITLTATFEPAGAASQNVTWSSSDESVATVNDNGVVTGVAPGNATITVTTEDGNHTASCTVTVTTSLPPVLIADFNDFKDIESLNGTISLKYQTGVTNPSRGDNIYFDLIDDPYNDGKCVAVSNGNNKNEEYCTINLNLPNTVNIQDYGILAFDICYPKGSSDTYGSHEDMNYKKIPISLIYTDGKSTQTVDLATFNTPVFPAPVWDTKMIDLKPLAGIDFEGASNFQIKIGPTLCNRCIYYLDNIRIKENVDDVEDYEQDKDLSDIWWKYDDANETLYIKGTGPIPAYKDNKKCPWEDRTPFIKHVIVSEGITGIGDYSVGNSQQNDVDITLHSIPEYFGAHCLERERQAGLTRTLHLQLWDAEKPFIANKKSDYFPTFNTAKYFRNVTNTYSTVCLPFPVAKETVKAAGVELFDFTSIKQDGDQYTLEFSKHSDELGMVAGQTYLIKQKDINGTLWNEKVDKGQFNLDPVESKKTITGRDPAFSISMKGVFQPSVFGSNIGTEQDPVYAYGFQNEKFYMNGGNMSVRPMRGYFYGSQLYSAPGYGEQQQSGAKKMPKMFNFEIVPDNVTHISSPAFIAEDFNIEEVYSPSGMKTESLNKGLNIIRTSTGRVLKVMVK